MIFGIANNVKSEVRVCTPELLNEVLDSPNVAKICAEIEDVLEDFRKGGLTQDEFINLKAQLKRRLPVVTFHSTFKNGRRKNDDAIPSGLAIYDLDHITNPRAKWEEIDVRKDELNVLLAHVTPSTEGLRLVFLIPQGMDLAQAQAWMAKQLGDTQYDASVKDYARCSFMVPREYILYMNEERLFASHPNIQNEVKNDNPVEYEKNNHGVHDEFPKKFKGIPYATIINEWFKRNGGEPSPGERNSKLHRLATHLRYITDNNEIHLLQILPNYGLKEEEMRTLISHACSSKFYGIPRTLKKLLADLENCMEAQSERKDEGTDETNYIDSPFPPMMPKRLPPLIKLLLSRTPDIYKPAVAHAIFPALGAHLWRTSFRYIDGVEHEATLMCCLLAGSGAGKSCVNEPINHIMKDIRQRDAENLLREKEWKKEMQSKAANKDKPKRPEGLVIQEIDPDCTNAAFVQRLADAEGHFLFAKMNELDQFDALKTNGNRYAHFQIMCLAFDPGNTYGQTRVGTGSVSERVSVRFNWTASSTLGRGISYFNRVLTDGPLSRINFCHIEEQDIGSDLPCYGRYDSDFDEELRPYIERLNKARGLVECKAAFQLAKKLREENAEFARLTQSRVFENFSFRANVIAFLKAMVLYIAHGNKWDKSMEDFVRWSSRTDLFYKMKFFGDAIEAQERSFSPIKKRGPQNLLSLLPDIFTRDDAMQMRQSQGIVGGNLASMLGMWKNRGYIEPYGPELPSRSGQQKYIKTKNYIRKKHNN